MVDIFDTSLENVEVEVSDNRITKGQDVNLSSLDPTMSNVVVSMGWDLNAFDADTLDLDLSCFLLNKDNVTRFDEDFIFYNNLQDRDESVVHNGDSRTGAGDGDDESVSINLNGIPFEATKVIFVLSIYRGEEKEQTLAGLRNSYIRILNASNSQELARYDLTPEVVGSKETGMLVASLNREGPKWHFEALGEFVEGGLAKIATNYDIIVHGG
ncbi:MAG: TerD family protein [Alphaproteobacteria bacterium]